MRTSLQQDTPCHSELLFSQYVFLRMLGWLSFLFIFEMTIQEIELTHNSPKYLEKI